MTGYLFVLLNLAVKITFSSGDDFEILTPDCLTVTHLTEVTDPSCVSVQQPNHDELYSHLANVDIKPECAAYIGDRFELGFSVTLPPGAAGECSNADFLFKLSAGQSCLRAKPCTVTGNLAEGCRARCSACTSGSDCTMAVITKGTSKSVGWSVCEFQLYYWKDIDINSLPNTAAHKPSESSGETWGGATGRANDGDTQVFYEQGQSCMHAGYQDNAWWMVDLGNSYVITHVMVTSRGDCPGVPACEPLCNCGDKCQSWMSNFEIRVGNNDESNIGGNGLCAVRPGRMPCGVTETFNCSQPLAPGRYVSLQVGEPVPNTYPETPSLTFCELQAFGPLANP